MRPDPTHGPQGDSTGKIIYLGDVRRRRRGRSRPHAPDRRYLILLGITATVSWAIWLAVLFTLAPARLLTYLAFFIPFSVALAATATLAAYAIDWRRGLFPNLVTCARRGIVLALVITANLAFVAAHRWILPVGGITVVAAVLSEIALEHRERAA